MSLRKRSAPVPSDGYRLEARPTPSSSQPPAPTQLSLCFARGLPEKLPWTTATYAASAGDHLARIHAVDVTVCSSGNGQTKHLWVEAQGPGVGGSR